MRQENLFGLCTCKQPCREFTQLFGLAGLVAKHTEVFKTFSKCQRQSFQQTPATCSGKAMSRMGPPYRSGSRLNAPTSHTQRTYVIRNRLVSSTITLVANRASSPHSSMSLRPQPARDPPALSISALSTGLGSSRRQGKPPNSALLRPPLGALDRYWWSPRHTAQASWRRPTGMQRSWVVICTGAR